jgi:hypothetical protein
VTKDRRRSVSRFAYTFVALLGAMLALGTPAMSSGNQGSGGASAGSRVAITVTGRGVGGDASGTFTLRGAASDAGTSHVIGNTSSAQRVLGTQALYRGRSQGPGELDGKKGHLSISWSGSFVPVNASTYVTTGTWRITGGTGTYKTWKGGGSFVSVDRHAPSPDSHTPSGVGSHEARWEGLVTR